jgi:hypothetical protein
MVREAINRLADEHLPGATERLNLSFFELTFCDSNTRFFPDCAGKKEVRLSANSWF